MGLSKSSIWRWVRRIEKYDRKAKPLPKPTAVKALVPIKFSNDMNLPEISMDKQSAEIILPSMLKLRIPNIVNVKLISELLQELQQCS